MRRGQYKKGQRVPYRALQPDELIHASRRVVLWRKIKTSGSPIVRRAAIVEILKVKGQITINWEGGLGWTNRDVQYLHRRGIIRMGRGGYSTNHQRSYIVLASPNESAQAQP
jgi:hypothetical protein